MKIALIGHLKYALGEPFAGGLEMHTHLLTRTLQARGHDVTLFAAEGTDARLRPVEVCPPTGDFCGDPVRDAAIEPNEQAAYERIMDAVERGGFDVVHNNSLHALPLARSGRVPAPVITVLHTPPFDSLVEGVNAARPDMVYAAVSRALTRQWRGIIDGPHIVSNGIDLSAFAARTSGEPEIDAFWSGRIVPEKGPHLAIDAARRAGLPIAFAGPRHNAAYWEREIAPRLGPGVTYLGHLAQPELARRLRSARAALVTPRWEEPFGLVVAEALACGTPVAGFRRGALPDILNDACGRLAAADDVDDLARALTEAVGLDRRACRHRAQTLFDAEAMTDRYEALYTEMLSAPVPVPPRLGRVAGLAGS
ncbi:MULTISPECIES: glycosyltransferase [Methylobacterium]|uniref:Glycogen synthase n=3 Tax=Pseudomonadota TaxID=1224 RepID=A0ABQ4SSK1_9HYPH|nr:MULTISPECIES: glycosyltransferase [Methylobacterium]PIU06506.1 MAG: glycosyltransferase family 4 protein [Methylobacterium sp. CG09_land_8_20_14_0_10_71_15]PIU16409.1 MAG: glycosyltransferase family 4 protein [Methylobacterium sp. CG08_land_8_20_14_0_20_71_15]GBU16463.1 glycosyl transferase family 1 [Methylobacterium sp.]GJE06072.1 Glycogen synthase [Methylobacterium jeotgali]